MGERNEVRELARHPSVGVGVLKARGVSEKVLRKRGLVRPFWGVRSAAPPTNYRERCLAYSPRLREGQVLGAFSAAAVLGLPLPASMSPDADIEVLVPKGAYRPSASGVASRSLRADRIQRVRVDGLPVTSPVLTFLLMSRSLELDDLVMVADAVVTRADNYPGLRMKRPMTTLAELDSAVTAWARHDGAGRARAALDEAREGVESPMETHTRLPLTRGGLPEPEINGEIWVGDRFLARGDLVYREAKVIIEFDGDGHRTDRAQWQRDIEREQELRDAGWLVIRVTAATLQQPQAFAARVRVILAARTA